MADDDLIGLLPPRVVDLYKLDFNIGERTFYEHVLQSLKTTRTAIYDAEVNQAAD